MRSMHCTLALGCAMLALAGCSGSEVRPLPQRLVKMGYAEQPAVQAVPHYTVEGWHALDARHIIVETGTATDYLITLAQDCEAMQSAVTIGFSSVNGDLQLSDDLIIHQVQNNYRCALQAINPLKR